jgi:predicted transcriptional regulator
VPVKDILYKQFKQIHPESTLGQLSVMLDTDYYVVIVKNKTDSQKQGDVVGIVTRIDLLNYITCNDPEHSSSVSGAMKNLDVQA